MILKVATSLVLSLLPLAILVRDWRFRDRRTRVHHQITRVILIVWFIAGLVAVVFVWQETYLSNVLDRKVDELVTGKNQLLDKIQKYQADLEAKKKLIEELEAKTSMLESRETFAPLKDDMQIELNRALTKFCEKYKNRDIRVLIKFEPGRQRQKLANELAHFMKQLGILGQFPIPTYTGFAGGPTPSPLRIHRNSEEAEFATEFYF